jgi:hypothetical protein
MIYLIIIGVAFAIAAYIILKDRKSVPTSNGGGIIITDKPTNGDKEKVTEIDSETLNPSDTNK